MLFFHPRGQEIKPMEPVNRIEIEDSEGWRKEFDLPKRITYIGSDPRNDIVLNPYRGAGVEHRHLQLITPQGPSSTVTAVNLSSTAAPLGDSGERAIPPNSAAEISNLEIIRLGDFVLVFHLHHASQEGSEPLLTAGVGGQVRGNQISAPIGLRLTLNSTALRPGSPLDGVITVRNQGTAQGVQFQIAVEGLPREYYEVGPAPILFPNAEKNIPLRLVHPRGPALPAGPLRITVRASAQDAYPGENVSVSREIQVEPYFHHTLELIEK
jgi:hypothetical protein